MSHALPVGNQSLGATTITNSTIVVFCNVASTNHSLSATVTFYEGASRTVRGIVALGPGEPSRLDTWGYGYDGGLLLQDQAQMSTSANVSFCNVGYHEYSG